MSVNTHQVVRYASRGNCKVAPINWTPPPGQVVRVMYQGNRAECDSFIHTRCPKSGGQPNCWNGRGQGNNGLGLGINIQTTDLFNSRIKNNQ